MGQVTNVYKILNAKPDRRKHFTELGIDGRMVLKWNHKLNMV